MADIETWSPGCVLVLRVTPRRTWRVGKLFLRRSASRSEVRFLEQKAEVATEAEKQIRWLLLEIPEFEVEAIAGWIAGAGTLLMDHAWNWRIG